MTRRLVKNVAPTLNSIAFFPFLRHHSAQIPFVKQRLAMFLQVEELVLVRDYKGRQRNSRVNPGFLGKDLVQSKERVHFGKWFLDFFCLHLQHQTFVLMYDR